MKITGHTRIIGIFGDPVEHTLSPVMHNAAFDALELDMVYVPFHVRSKPASDLKAAVASIKALNILGMNITVPHKETVIKYLDEVDEYAREVGAVNTIVNKGGRLTGYNTDGAGYLLSLREETGFVPKDKNIIILGAGGAARSILYAVLSGKPRSVVIANRTIERADDLAAEFKGRFKKISIKTVLLEKHLIKEHAWNADLIINTTSLGMMGRGAVDLPIENLPGHSIVSDIVYRPLKTTIIKKAAARGLATHTGLGMLVHQGAIGFELWTGQMAPTEVMMKAALKVLREK